MNIPVGTIWLKKADPTCVVKVISVDDKMVEIEGRDKDMNIVRGKFAAFRFMDEYDRIDVDIDPSKELNITTTSESTNPAKPKTMENNKIRKRIKIGSIWTNGTIEVIVVDIISDMIYTSDNKLGKINMRKFPRDEFLRDFTEIKSDQVTAPSEITWPGAIWYHTNGGIHIAITIKEENGSVWFVSSDNKVLDLYWEMPFKEWIKTYKLYNGVDKPKCFPEGSFDEMLKETEDRYKRVMENNKTRFLRDYTEIKSDVEKNNPTNLKTDVTKLEDFGTGAKREDKSGKGRYDLIPGDIMNAVEDYAYKLWFVNGVTTVTATDVSESAYFDDWTDIEAYYEFISNMICHFFAPTKNSFTSDCGEITGEYSWNGFRVGLVTMRKALAKHYEDGAKIHGVDNWKKGLPVYGSARGGCFLDSMRRHTDQALAGMDDEPHAIAAIWNAFGAAWTLKHKPHCAVYQNSSEIKADDYTIAKPMTVDEWEKLFQKYGIDKKDVAPFPSTDEVELEAKTTSSTPEILEWLESDYTTTDLSSVKDDAIRFMHYNLNRCHEFLLQHVQDWVDGKRNDPDTIFTEYAFLTYLLDDRLEEFMPFPEMRHAILAIVRTGYNILMRDGFKGSDLYVVAVPDDYKYDKHKSSLAYDKMIIDTCAQIISHSKVDKWRGYDLIRPFAVIQTGLKAV